MDIDVPVAPTSHNISTVEDGPSMDDEVTSVSDDGSLNAELLAPVVPGVIPTIQVLVGRVNRSVSHVLRPKGVTPALAGVVEIGTYFATLEVLITTAVAALGTASFESCVEL